MVRKQGIFQNICGPGEWHPACLEVKVPAVNNLVNDLQLPPAELSWLFLLTESVESQGLTVLGRRQWARIAFLPLLTSYFVVVEAFVLAVSRRWNGSQPHRFSLSLMYCLGISSSSIQHLRIFYDEKQIWLLLCWAGKTGFGFASCFSNVSDYCWKAFCKDKLLISKNEMQQSIFCFFY